jgi:hypothetical protein
MTNMAKQLRLHSLFALALMGLAGCVFETDQRVAGGAEDFPNTLQPLGMALNDDISTSGSGADWDQFSDIPPTLPSFHGSDSLVLQPGTAAAKEAAPPGSALAKTSGSELSKPDTTWDLSDTATLRVARRYIRQELLLKIRRDTTTFRYDDKFTDGVAGNEIALESKGLEAARSGLRVHTYHYFNRDSAGALDSAVFFLRYRGSDSLYRYNWLAAVGGADGNIFTNADNVPAYYAFAKTNERGGKTDTLDAFDISDADGDGLLWGANDSGLVDFREKKTDPDGRPAVKSVVHKMRALLFKDEAKTYPVSFVEIRTDRDGKRVTFSVKGTRADSAFGPGDTVYVSVKTVPAAGTKKFEERNVRFVVLLSQIPKRFQDNRLLMFSLDTRWRADAWNKGGVRRTIVRFKPDQAVPSQHLAQAGELQADADFTDGSNGSVTGRFEGDRLEVEFTGNDGGKPRKFKVRWSLSGDFLSPPEKL